MNSRKKIIGLEILKRRIQKLHRQGKKIAFTNGCFDIIHFGHVQYLEKAKKNNRILIVGINSDASVRKIKGPKRPVVREQFRAAVVAALVCVDFVLIFNEATPYKLIQAIQPDILIKGADWKGKEVIGSDIVKKINGSIELVEYVKGFSTTEIIEKIKASFS